LPLAEIETEKAENFGSEKRGSSGAPAKFASGDADSWLLELALYWINTASGWSPAAKPAAKRIYAARTWKMPI